LRKIKRTTIFHVSKSQRVFFYPVIIAFFLGCIVAWLTLTYFLIGEYLADPAMDQLQRAIPILLTVATISMFAVIFWTLRISNRHFGSYDRVIGDLDDVLSGAKKEPLTTRKGDVIFEELLKRINALIKKNRIDLYLLDYQFKALISCPYRLRIHPV